MQTVAGIRWQDWWVDCKTNNYTWQMSCRLHRTETLAGTPDYALLAGCRTARAGTEAAFAPAKASRQTLLRVETRPCNPWLRR